MNPTLSELALSGSPNPGYTPPHYLNMLQNNFDEVGGCFPSASENSLVPRAGQKIDKHNGIGPLGSFPWMLKKGELATILRLNQGW